MDTLRDQIKGWEYRMYHLLEDAGIPVKKVTMTRVTIIVKMHGEVNCEKVRQILHKAGYTRLNILDNRPTLYDSSPDWRVTGWLPR